MGMHAEKQQIKNKGTFNRYQRYNFEKHPTIINLIIKFKRTFKLLF